MTKPWEENYGTAAAQKTDGPWNDYAPAPSATASPEVVQEMHPELGFGDRFVAKNFANSPEAMVGYLKKEHPDLEVQLGADGRPIVRKPGEKQFRVLDPDNASPFSTDVVMDVTDSAYDLLAGFVESAAAAGAGVAAAPTGPGALLAGAAAGAGTGAALEYGRQGLGKAFGIDQDIDHLQAGVAGLTGAAAPVLFGTGGAAKQVATKAVGDAVKQGAPELATGLTKQYTQAQKGLLPRAWDGVKSNKLPMVPDLATLGEVASGVPAERIKTAAARLPELEALEKNGVTDLLDETHEKISGALADSRADIGRELERTLGDGAVIETAPIKSAFQGLIDELTPRPGDTPSKADLAKLQKIQSVMDKYFTGYEVGEDGAMKAASLPDFLSPKRAQEMKLDFADLADFGKLNEHALVARNADDAPVDRMVARAAEKAYAAINDQFDVKLKGNKELRAKYHELSKLQKDLNRYFKTPEKTDATLRGLSNRPRRVLFEKLQKFDEKYGTDTLGAADLFQAHVSLGKNSASFSPTASKGSTNSWRAVPLAAVGAGLGAFAGASSGVEHGGYLGGGVGGMAGALVGGPKAIRFYIDAAVKSGQGKDQILKGLANMGVPPQAIPTSIWNSVHVKESQEGKNR